MGLISSPSHTIRHSMYLQHWVLQLDSIKNRRQNTSTARQPSTINLIYTLRNKNVQELCAFPKCGVSNFIDYGVFWVSKSEDPGVDFGPETARFTTRDLVDMCCLCEPLVCALRVLLHSSWFFVSVLVKRLQPYDFSCFSESRYKCLQILDKILSAAIGDWGIALG